MRSDGGPDPLWLLSSQEDIRTQTRTEGNHVKTAICKPRRRRSRHHPCLAVEAEPPNVCEKDLDA